jgi:isoquinoline 1-oxidoreductase alpha subunit
LWVIRDYIGLTGTKFGCGMAQCGACTVHVNGEATRSCITPIVAVEGKRVNTIRGPPDAGHEAVRAARLDKDVAQCGYCQPGQIMSATALLAKNAKPTDAEIEKP